MNERWKMNRIGFVNFWLYDEEDFEFEDMGHMRIFIACQMIMRNTLTNFLL